MSGTEERAGDAADGPAHESGNSDDGVDVSAVDVGGGSADAPSSDSGVPSSSGPSSAADRAGDGPTATPAAPKEKKVMTWQKSRAVAVTAEEEDERRALGAGDTVRAQDRLPSPETTASCCSRAVWSWVGRIFAIGNARPLVMDDLWGLAESDQSKRVADDVGEAMASTGGDLGAALKSLYKADFIVIGIIRVFNNLAQFAPSLVLSVLLQHLAQIVSGVAPEERIFGEYGGYILSACVVASQVSHSFLENHMFYRALRLGLKVRTAVTTAVYRKALRLSPAARQGASTGDVVTLMQNDATRLEMSVTPLHNLWASPMQIIGFMTLLVYFIGASALVGLLVMLLIIPLQGIAMMKLGGYRKKIVKQTSSRVKLANEILQGIKAIKFYSWEEPFRQLSSELRDKELSMIKKSAKLQALNSAFISMSPALVAVCSLAVYSHTGGSMEAHIIFAALSVFQQLRFPLMMLPMTANSLAEAKVSLNRLNRYLQATEVTELRLTNGDDAVAGNAAATPTPPSTRSMDPLDVSIGEVVVDNATFFWANPHAKVVRVAEALAKKKRNAKKKKKKKLTEEERKKLEAAEEEARKKEEEDRKAAAQAAVPAIREASFKVGAGELVAVVGSVGVGKSALCSAILSELHCDSGRVAFRGSVAYVAQSAWILNATVKNNILFGHRYDKERYRETLHACELEADLRVLPNHEDTEIGERGINLSGGQKQRIALARAMYADADIVVFDDPLSALDAEVGNAVFKKVIVGALKSKTRLFVTNQLHLLGECDRIIVLASADDGSAVISEVGTLDELMASGREFSALMESYSGRDGAEGAEDADEADGEAAADGDEEVDVRGRSLSSGSRSVSPHGRKKARTLSISGSNENAKLMEDEERAVGAVAAHVWWSYFKIGGVCFALWVFLLYVATQFIGIYFSFWVAIWADDHEYENHTVDYYMGGYALIALITAILAYARAFSMVWLGIRASQNFHVKLIARVLRAPMSFFDTTPLGRILSRFSKDLDAIDTILPAQLQWMTLMIFLSVGSLAGITFETPLFAIALLPAVFMYAFVLKYYRSVARELKRLDSITRSPVYAHFSETLGGLSTIRAFGQIVRFTLQHYASLDKNHTAAFVTIATARWLSVRMEALGQSLVLLASMLSTQAVISGNITDAEAAFAISLAMSVSGLLNWSVRMFTEAEAQMNSVERVVHTMEETPQEAPAVMSGDARLPEGWPSGGEVKFENVRMRYRPKNPLVLKDVSFTIRAGEKVGIVGRTGSGKSSLLLTIFRIVELESGSISIDGVPIGGLGLNTLRRQLSIIPQDPVLFTGDVRDNLDPFHEHDDADLWDAINKVGLRTTVVQQATAAKVAAETSSGEPGVDATAASTAAASSAADGAAEAKEGGEEETDAEKAEAEALARKHAQSLAGDELIEFGLGAPVTEGGENWSTGERQLLCLARVMLRKSRVLLLDEATSSVDFETDQRVQEALRSSFKTCTVITIAHRLQTIADSDRIIVMDDGKVAQFDTPHKLLQHRGPLSDLVSELGPAAEAQLRAIAAEHAGAAEHGSPARGAATGAISSEASETALPAGTDADMHDVEL